MKLQDLQILSRRLARPARDGITSKLCALRFCLDFARFRYCSRRRSIRTRPDYPHDMIWFNVPKNPQPGVTHHGYHSASMNKEIGYNIWLPPDYES